MKKRYKDLTEAELEAEVARLKARRERLRKLNRSKTKRYQGGGCTVNGRRFASLEAAAEAGAIPVSTVKEIRAARLPEDWGGGWPNVWLGVSVESERYYHRLDTLAGLPAAVRFVSAEPLLGPLDLTPWLDAGALDWVITGGESGAGCRPADPAWFRAIRDQCLAAGVAYFHKQNGGADKAHGGNVLDGRTWEQYPARPAA